MRRAGYRLNLPINQDERSKNKRCLLGNRCGDTYCQRLHQFSGEQCKGGLFKTGASAHIFRYTRKLPGAGFRLWAHCLHLKKARLSAQVEGRVDKVLVDVGDVVSEGQPLVLLDQSELQFEVDRQQGVVKQVRAQLGIGPNDPPPATAKKMASVQRAEADLFDADRKYGRAREMFKDNLISQQQFDEAGSRDQSAQASYNLALQDVDRLKALLISSEASAALAEKKLGDATIRAPFPGAVQTRNVHPGEYLRLQSPVLVLVRTDHLRARLAVPERWAGWIKDGGVVDLHVEAFPGETFEEHISRINPTVIAGLANIRSRGLARQQGGTVEAGILRSGFHAQRKRRQSDICAGESGELPLRRLQSFCGNWKSRCRETNPSRRTDRRPAL